MESCERKPGVKSSLVSFVYPLGSVIDMPAGVVNKKAAQAFVIKGLRGVFLLPRAGSFWTVSGCTGAIVGTGVFSSEVRIAFS